MQRAMSAALRLAVMAALAAIPVRAAEIQYGVLFDPAVQADGSVTVTIRNLSKVPVTVRNVALAPAGRPPCAGVVEPAAIAPGQSAERRVAGCVLVPPAAADRVRLLSLSERPAAEAGAPSNIVLSATLDRLGESREVKAGWTAALP